MCTMVHHKLEIWRSMKESPWAWTLARRSMSSFECGARTWLPNLARHMLLKSFSRFFTRVFTLHNPMTWLFPSESSSHVCSLFCGFQPSLFLQSFLFALQSFRAVRLSTAGAWCPSVSVRVEPVLRSEQVPAGLPDIQVVESSRIFLL